MNESLPYQPGAARSLRGGSGPSFAELFTPKLITVLREGYSFRSFRADIVSGLTVAVVAVPLSMAIAIASGTTPDRGLYTAIVGGFLVSALGGSRFQIGGPAGAFIVLVAMTVALHGIDGLILATFLAGLFLVVAGFLRLGTYVKFIPYPVTVGFTSGIAVIIFASQIKDLFGITLQGKEPGPLIPKIQALTGAIGTISFSAFALSLATIAIIVGLKKIRPNLPGMLIAVAVGSLIAWLLHLPVETIGTRFGGIPQSLPVPHLPDLSFDKIQAVLPDAFAFALLGSIESLLSAVVADGMTGRRHRSNCELVAQGAANVGSAFFGGICVTGTIARTATNVRSGARSPISGMLHSVFLVGFILIAAPLASYIPLATLAAVLAVVSWNMAEKHEFATLIRSSWGDAAVLLATFLLTIFRDLTEGIIVGFALGSILFIHRMAQTTGIEELAVEDKPDSVSDRSPYDAAMAGDPDVMIYRITGAFFFGAASTIGAVLDGLAADQKALIIDFAAVPFLDSTAAHVIAKAAEKAERQRVRIFLTGATVGVRRELFKHGAKPPLVEYRADVKEAYAEIKDKPVALPVGV